MWPIRSVWMQASSCMWPMRSSSRWTRSVRSARPWTPSRWRRRTATGRWSPTGPARRRIPLSQIWQWRSMQGRSRRARPAEATGRRSTTSFCGSRRTWEAWRAIRSRLIRCKKEERIVSGYRTGTVWIFGSGKETDYGKETCCCMGVVRRQVLLCGGRFCHAAARVVLRNGGKKIESFLRFSW